ncbi:hypothetical protein [Methylogaea oryzae]|uniref:Uncharacterized protein n=1 Tax=Methylogaea oryzae TaxID=1295382 RepID=A0A8D4VMH7_9GAMM|nr:hypothetical protein [Methylogaea oryzae]BBL70898.1 hypothetical protein MoryE10_15040 [Methylogaea oryzae]
MNKSKFLLAAVACLLLAGCQQPDGAYAAVHQIVPDPVILHLGGALYLAKDRENNLFLIEADDFGEATIISRIY